MRKLLYSPMVRCLAALLAVMMLCAGLYVLEEQGKVVWDLTPDMLTRLSEGTLSTLEKLEERVALHLVFKAETETSLRQMLEVLAGSYSRQGCVVWDVIDPVAEPGRIRAFAESGKSVAEGSVIIANGDESRWTVVPAAELVTYQVTSQGSLALTGFSAEQKMTEGIRLVTGGERRQVWFLTGHGEAGMDACTKLVSRLQGENYTVGEMTLLQGEEMKPGDILLVLSPVRDMTGEEAEEISRFLNRGGRMLMAMDASLDMTAMPRFHEVVQRCSLAFGDGIVIEDERMTGYWMNSPLYLMPAMQTQSQALQGMQQGQRVILPGARGIIGPEMPLSGYSYEALLTTSDAAYVCPMERASFAREAGMPVGRQQLAVSVSHYDEDADAEMRMVLLGSLYTLADNSLMNSTYNLDMSMQLIGYLAQRDAQSHVPVRSLTDESLPALSAKQGWQLLAVTLCLPACAMAAGVLVLMRRRKK